MSWITLTKRAVGACLPKSVVDAIIDDINDLDARSQLLEGAGVLNGSFQQDGDADGVPDAWTADGTGGATFSLDTSTYFHASQSVKVTLGATDQYGQLKSGESASTGDYVPCAYGERIEVELAVKASAAGIPAEAAVRFFDAGGTQVGSDQSAWSDSSADTTWKRRRGQVVAPSGAYYYRLILQAGDSGGSAAGSVYFDAVRTSVYHGFVPVSAVEVATGTGTVTLSSGSGHFTAGEQPLRAHLELDNTAGGTNACGLRVSGNSVTGFQCYAGITDRCIVNGTVELNYSYQCTISVTIGTVDTLSVKLLGYEV